MSIATYITSIEANRNTIRNKLVELGMAASGDKLDKLATAIEGIINQGAVSATVQEGGTYTIPAGYHNGSGTVSGVSGGGNYTLQTKTATPTKKQQNITPDSGFYGLSSVTVNAMTTATQATPDISVSSSGLITASATQTEGYVSAGTKSATKQLTTQAAQTITPGTSNKTIPSGQYLTGIQTILGDANLVAGNIKKGVSIFNVLGTLEATSGVGGSSNMRTGTFTVSRKITSPYTFSHDLGVTPDFAFVFMEDNVYFQTLSDDQIFNFIMRKPFTATNVADFSGFECLISVYQKNAFPLFNPLSADTLNARLTSSSVTINAEDYYILKQSVVYRWVVGTLS